MGEESLLQMSEIKKQFSENLVLKGVDMSVLSGQIHALIGGNGAGKSTLMKIITGLYQADSGQLLMKGEQVHFNSPAEAHKKGIYLVPQEPLIFPNMSVEENISIGLKQPKKTVKQKIRELNSKLGWNLDLSRSASTLSIAEQQLVELLRGLMRDAELLILDEPTSTLTHHEISSLFRIVKQLASSGKGIVYITHRFSEIFELAHHISVLRDGVISASGPVSQFSYEKLVQNLMPEGKTFDSKASVSPCRQEGKAEDKTPILSVKNLFGKRFHSVSFTVCKGEVVGIAGIVGAGRTELAEAIFGISQCASGEVCLEGEDITTFSVRERIDRGLVYIPEDRYAHGVFSIASLKGNLTSAILHKGKGWILPFKQEQKIAEQYISQLNVKALNCRQSAESLSGGNQQKIVLGKYLAAKPKVILFDEPTRGIDASARLDIYELISELKKKGISIVLISSDPEEIMALSDHVWVMHEGKLVKKLEDDAITLDQITSASFGVEEEVTAP
ncbi:sugar ABC transporter ATP-binding protein [Fictibacillus sp. WQ 8-8]|uniref:sugar ABC transporter ATP-binding protein n=1 Tax=Fictibacillus sp. WQ 8-8 TaxID=2938788 RepID=UPI00210EE07C|nr:sugar ABC transporter ATP-binding protein [Fictibacillus sp. WQ 8-8]MCQ6265202.1 sugar ABC transporter ATP-binding protein [Fictibacillus sp. WQ 8-8]